MTTEEIKNVYNISKESFDKLVLRAENDSYTISYDYRDELSLERLKPLLKGDFHGFYDYSSCMFHDDDDYNEYVKVRDYIENLIEDELDEEEFENCNLSELIEEIRLEHLEVDYNIEELINNSESFKINVVPIASNGEYVEWLSSGFYSRKLEYDETVSNFLSELNMNPRKVHKLLEIEENVNNWPNLKERNGKELINDSKFLDMILEHTTEYSVLTFSGSIDPIDLYKILETGQKFKTITIPKDTPVHIWDMENGACGLQAYTNRDIEYNIEDVNISIDGEWGYGLNNICGSMDWDSEFKIK